jgi:hypothetical protein
MLTGSVDLDQLDHWVKTSCERRAAGRKLSAIMVRCSAAPTLQVSPTRISADYRTAPAADSAAATPTYPDVFAYANSDIVGADADTMAEALALLWLQLHKAEN